MSKRAKIAKSTTLNLQEFGIRDFQSLLNCHYILSFPIDFTSKRIQFFVQLYYLNFYVVNVRCRIQFKVRNGIHTYYIHTGNLTVRLPWINWVKSWRPSLISEVFRLIQYNCLEEEGKQESWHLVWSSEIFWLIYNCLETSMTSDHMNVLKDSSLKW